MLSWRAGRNEDVIEPAPRSRRWNEVASKGLIRPTPSRPAREGSPVQCAERRRLQTDRSHGNFAPEIGRSMPSLNLTTRQRREKTDRREIDMNDSKENIREQMRMALATY